MVVVPQTTDERKEKKNTYDLPQNSKLDRLLVYTQFGINQHKNVVAANSIYYYSHKSDNKVEGLLMTTDLYDRLSYTLLRKPCAWSS